MDKLKEILFLSNIKGIGPVSLNKTYIPKLSHFKDFSDFKESLKTILPERFQTQEILENASKLTGEVLNQISKLDITPLTVLDKNYPDKLKDLNNKTPPILYTKGNIKALSMDSLGVIGTRDPSPMAKKFEKNFTEKIIEKTGRVIVSGLAIGCDTIAHKLAVDLEIPTIAVLPAGVGNIIPPQNEKLAESIIETGGCIVSNYRPLERLHRTAYITRDQYTAALSDGVFVPQCSRESGTMYTVNYARDLSRKISCFMPDNTQSFDFTGNRYILENDYDAFKITSLKDLDGFLRFLS